MYPWVANEKKFERAVLALKNAKLEVTEQAVKELYVRYGGLLIEKTPVESAEEAPKKRSKKVVEAEE